MGLVLGLKKQFQKFLVRTFFEGAKKTKATRDFANATNQNFEELAMYDRDMLRARARWLSANNPIMSNIDSTIINNVVGRGISLQSVDDTLQEAWNTWQKSCDLTGRRTLNDMQRLMLQTRMVDGECFIYKKYTKNGFKIQLLEADQLDTYAGKSGLDIDKDGKVTAYYFKTDGDTVKIDAKHIINYHKSNRISQYRGVSEYSRSIIDIKNFQGFTSANIQSLRARANIAYAVEGDDVNPFDYNATDQDGDKIQEINDAFVFYLNAGEKIHTLDSNATPVNYQEFVQSTVRMIATGRNISYELAFRDFSQVNFSSARASILQDNKRFDSEQEHMITYILEDLYKTWYEYEVLNGREAVELPVVSWVVPVREWVRPKEDLSVVLEMVDRNLSTYTDAAKSRGKVFEEILVQRQAEEALIKKYGLNTEEIQNAITKA